MPTRHPWLLALFATSLMSASPAGADTCCVDADMAEAFLPHFRLFREVPSEYPPMPGVPDEFDYVGGRENTHHHRSITLAWRSEQSLEQAFLAMGETVQSNGWRLLPESREHRGFGFVDHRDASPVPSQGATYCRDEIDTRLHLMGQEREGRVYVLLSSSKSTNELTCDQQMLEQAGQSVRSQNSRSYIRMLPRLALPEGVPVIGRGSSGGGDGYTMRARTAPNATTNMDELVDYFEPQLIQQGWQRDTTYRGGVAAGSVWTRRVDDVLFIGRLNVLERASFTLLFSIDRPEE
ncbi:MAG: hypothetical protein AAF184_17905 [Pseudomonadota bacterium]